MERPDPDGRGDATQGRGPHGDELQLPVSIGGCPRSTDGLIVETQRGGTGSRRSGGPRRAGGRPRTGSLRSPRLRRRSSRRSRPVRGGPRGGRRARSGGRRPGSRSNTDHRSRRNRKAAGPAQTGQGEKACSEGCAAVKIIPHPISVRAFASPCGSDARGAEAVQSRRCSCAAAFTRRRHLAPEGPILPSARQVRGGGQGLTPPRCSRGPCARTRACAGARRWRRRARGPRRSGR